MMNEKKNYKVQIFEESYVLSSDEPEFFVLKAAEMVDLSMKEISYQSALVDAKKIAVLAALRIAGKLLQKENIQTTNEQRLMILKNYIEQELYL